MAVFNELQAGRLNRALQKFVGIKGAPPVRQLGTEILPVFPMFWGAECRYLESWNRFANATAFGPSAANFNMMQLRNPAGSGVVAVIEKCSLVNDGAASDIFIVEEGIQTVDFSVGTAGQRFDARGNVASALIFSSRQNASGPGLPVIFRGAAGVNGQSDAISTDIQEFPLLPGDAVALQNSVVNNGSIFVLWWRERLMEEAERF